jgi:hypothetical protein
MEAKAALNHDGWNDGRTNSDYRKSYFEGMKVREIVAQLRRDGQAQREYNPDYWDTALEAAHGDAAKARKIYTSHYVASFVAGAKEKLGIDTARGRTRRAVSQFRRRARSYHIGRRR